MRSTRRVSPPLVEPGQDQQSNHDQNAAREFWLRVVQDGGLAGRKNGGQLNAEVAIFGSLVKLLHCNMRIVPCIKFKQL